MDNGLLEFLDYSHSQFHSIDKISKILLSDGYIELKESDEYVLEKGKKYFVKRNLTSLLAFKIPNEIKDYHFQMVAVHSDSPNFKIKDHVYDNSSNCFKLIVEPYGGMIHSTWLDKPLGVAGRIVYKNGDQINSKLVDLGDGIAIIPNLAIHLNREINDGYKYNPQTDLCPILASSNDENIFEKTLNNYLEEDQELLSYDLYLYNSEKAQLIGLNKDFLSSPKLDDLACDYTCLKGFMNGENKSHISLFVSFDNEEVGSGSINGADSTFLEDNLRRINTALGYKEKEFLRALAKSTLLSADNAHAIHPNIPNKLETKSPVLLNKGIVIKHNANMHYCSDALGAGLIKSLCKDIDIPYQEFFNRSDIRGGSTLGNISMAHVSILSVDIGLAQLAMHSSYETMGSKDIDDMIMLITAYMSKDIVNKDGNINIR